MKTVKKKGESSSVPEASHVSQSKVPHSTDATADSKNSTGDKVCLNMAEIFRALFHGSQIVVGNAYFERRVEPLGHHLRITAVWSKQHSCIGFDTKEAYVNAFSIATWKALPSLEKSHHSLSNCNTLGQHCMYSLIACIISDHAEDAVLI